jgi:dolichyl-diphosphooligosaccharide---protein glycosyltransferase
MQVRFVWFSAVSASEHLFGHFVFILLQVLRLDLKVWAGWLRKYGAQVSVCAFGLIFGLVQLFGLSQWSERTLTLLDPSYAIKYIPIVASVAEHQSTSWHDFLFYNNSLLLLVPAGLWVIFRSAAN